MTIKTRRPGFSLMELIVATMISAFIAMSLVTINTTANRHVFQSSRANEVKAQLTIGMKAIRNGLGQGTLIVEPAKGSSGNRLVVASNLSQNPDLTGCYPIAAGQPVAWQLFCTNTVTGPYGASVTQLLAYSNTINGGGCTCPASCSLNIFPSFACGANGNNKLVVASYLNTATPLFSRVAGDVLPNDSNSVLVRLHAIWTPTHGLENTQRSVDHALSSIFTVTGRGN